jgi:4-hydroxy-3-polyprenylbenzoate decarboxylase
VRLVIYRDLREFIDLVENVNVLRHIYGADPNLEIGGITEIAAKRDECPALLFDRIAGYPPGFRIFTNAINTPQRAALALGIDPTLRPVEALHAWMKKRVNLQIHRPVTVKDAAFLENTDEGEAVDLGKFPVPIWHRGDGGPYIGSGSIVIMRDPDTGWINASIYRVQVHGKTEVTVQFDHPGRHGAIIAKKYWDQGKPCPIAVVNGEDPALFIAGFESLPAGCSELDFAGGIKEGPVEVCLGPRTGLPIPTRAEIILEGAFNPGVGATLMEGPFGEFTGYYASERRPLPVMQVDAIHYRNDPVLLGSPPLKPPRHHCGLPFRGAGIWSNLENCGITDIAGVWQHVSSLMTVISLKQRYDGHAKRAGLIAAANAYMGRIVVIVDEDIDPSNINDVMWAVATRCEPSETIDIIRNGWSSMLDPRIPPADKERGVTSHSKIIINACRPFQWIGNFPPTTALAQAEAREIEGKWLDAITGRDRTP